VEVSIRPVLRPPREVRLRQLLEDPLLGATGDPRCFALDASEACADKVRAAFTRDASRDFYDLDRLLDTGADLSSPQFVGLVDAKLAERRAEGRSARPPGKVVRPRCEPAPHVGGGPGERDLPGVLRADAPPFDLGAMLARFDRLWGRS